MKKDKNKHALIVVILVILLLGVMLVSLLLGRFSISVRECLGILASKIFPVEPYWTQVQDNML
jgi:iron complex transport system permease protein